MSFCAIVYYFDSRQFIYVRIISVLLRIRFPFGPYIYPSFHYSLEAFVKLKEKGIVPQSRSKHLISIEMFYVVWSSTQCSALHMIKHANGYCLDSEQYYKT